MIVVTTESWTSPAATRLVAALTTELDERYEGIDSEDEDTELGVLSDDAHFVVARIAAAPVGCGAVVAWDGSTAEVKRVYVAPEARGRGVARAVMGALEAAAAERGITTLHLETGRMQPEAIALYGSLGYEQVPCGGRMRSAAWSVCMQKRLRAGAAPPG